MFAGLELSTDEHVIASRNWALWIYEHQSDSAMFLKVQYNNKSFEYFILYRSDCRESSTAENCNFLCIRQHWPPEPFYNIRAYHTEQKPDINNSQIDCLKGLWPDHTPVYLMGLKTVTHISSLIFGQIVFVEAVTSHHNK